MLLLFQTLVHRCNSEPSLSPTGDNFKLKEDNRPTRRHSISEYEFRSDIELGLNLKFKNNSFDGIWNSVDTVANTVNLLGEIEVKKSVETIETVEVDQSEMSFYSVDGESARDDGEETKDLGESLEKYQMDSNGREENKDTEETDGRDQSFYHSFCHDEYEASSA